MRINRSVELHVLGYEIERQRQFDNTGTLQSTRYEVRCPRGTVLGRLQSLRMAKRFVVTHELGDFPTRGKRERGMQGIFAA